MSWKMAYNETQVYLVADLKAQIFKFSTKAD